MPRFPRPVSVSTASPSSTALLPVRIHAVTGRVFLSVGAASRDLTPGGARHVAEHLNAAADAAETDAPEFDVTAAGRGHRTPHALTLPGGLVGLRFDTASLTLTEAQALTLADRLADAAEATRDVLGTRDPQ